MKVHYTARYEVAQMYLAVFFYIRAVVYIQGKSTILFNKNKRDRICSRSLFVAHCSLPIHSHFLELKNCQIMHIIICAYYLPCVFIAGKTHQRYILKRAK